tara:strand:+ start:101 stop:1012 length:912 start_codon:yes stop_codon:yes gene_type:complete
MKKRCTARTKKNIEIWGSHFSKNSFGVQCTNVVTNTDTNTCKCHTNLPFGTYLNVILPENFIIDLDENTYKFLKENKLSTIDFKLSQKTTIKYLIDTLEDRGYPLPSYLKSKGIEHQQYILNRLNSKNLKNDVDKLEFDKIYNRIMNGIIYQPQIIDYIISNTLTSLKKNVPIQPRATKKNSEHYLQQQEWWSKQHKVEITDYDTHQQSIFALKHVDDGSAVLLTKSKVTIGKSLHWKDEAIPEEFKNNSDIIVCPFAKYYLSHIQLFGDMKSFHNLPKSDYFEYHYEAKFNILQKTNEIRFM